jgi:hypothetical protein
MSREKLPSDLLWKEGGHLTDEAVSAMADGQEHLLPADAIAHADACEECARNLGEAAMLSAAVGLSLGGAWGDACTSAPPVSQRMAPPFWAIAFGLGFATLGTLPFLMGIPGWLLRTVVVLERAVPVFVHGAFALFASNGVGSEGLQQMTVTLASMAVLMMSLLAVSRLTPRDGVAR